MPSLSIKNVPESVVVRLRARAVANHRSLQGELMAVVCQAAEAGVTAGSFAPQQTAEPLEWESGWMSVEEIAAPGTRPTRLRGPRMHPGGNRHHPPGAGRSMSELFVVQPRYAAYRRLPPLVVDCSVLAALYFQEESEDQAASLLSGKSLFAPWLIDYEMASVALKKVEAGQPEVAKRGLQALADARLGRRSINTLAQWELARREGLSAYDAAYLQTAIELDAPLATFDRALGTAAERALGGR